jgi:DNA-directed RNA polymerase subunit RPC12/RpoP
MLRFYYCPHCKKQLDSTSGEKLIIQEPYTNCPNCQNKILIKNAVEWEFLSPIRRKLTALGFTTKLNIMSKSILLIPLLFITTYPLIMLGAWQATIIALAFLFFIYILPIIQFHKSKEIKKTIIDSIQRTSDQNYVNFLEEFLQKKYHPLSKKEKVKWDKNKGD